MTTSDATSAGRSSLAERRRWATQVEIAEASATLFDTLGYDATTVEQIAERAGISLRTFYRYCSGKDDVFTRVLDRQIESLVEVFHDAPAATSLSNFVVAAFAGHVPGRETLPLSDRLGVYLTTIPQLRNRLLGAEGAAQQRLAPVIAQRLDLDAHGLRARAITAIVVAAAVAAIEHAAVTGLPLDECLAEAMELVEHGL